MDSLTKIKNLLTTKDQKTKLLIGAFVTLGLLSFFLSHEKTEVVAPAAEKPAASADTFIPNGYVLVPIEVANANSLSSLLGEVGGVVDLYLAQGKKSTKVASKLKILRAPYNPDLYAVLVREQESAHLLSFTGPFVAVVQNPTEKGNKLVEGTTRKFSIDYQN